MAPIESRRRLTCRRSIDKQPVTGTMSQGVRAGRPIGQCHRTDGIQLAIFVTVQPSGRKH